MAKEIKLTQESLDAYKDELEYLKTTRADEVAEQLKEARSFGDLSENAEYDEAKNEQGKLYSRIAELEEIIKHAVVVTGDTYAADEVSPGCRFVVKDLEDDEEEEYHFVGSQEADPMDGKISDESPFGKAMLGKKVGDGRRGRGTGRRRSSTRSSRSRSKRGKIPSYRRDSLKTQINRYRKMGKTMAEQHQAQEQHEQTAEELHELKRIRREKLAELQAAGNDPFQQVRFERDHYTTDIHEHFDELEGKTVRLAGRMMSKRIMGKASFSDMTRPLRPPAALHQARQRRRGRIQGLQEVRHRRHHRHRGRGIPHPEG